jgi:putative aldouronate transport system substrate-binding protein
MKKYISLLLAACLALTMLTSCGNSATEASVSSASETTKDVSVQSAEADAAESAQEPEMIEEIESSVEESIVEEAEPVVISYPIFDEMVELTIFGSASSQFLGSVDMTTYSQTGAVQALEEATGIRLDYSSMTNDDVYAEKLSLTIASGDYPDFICKASTYYATGAEGLLEEEVCIDMVDYLDEYAPDLKALLDTDTDYANLVYSDTGALVSIPMRAAPTTDGGGIIRQDWLDELGMEVPETYDELHDVLMAFKDNYGCTNALAVLGTLSTPLNFGFNIPFDASQVQYVVRDGKVVANMTEDAAREYVELLAGYYADGLFTSDFLSNVNMMAFDQMAASNDTGFWMSGRMTFNGTFEASMQDTDAVLTPVKDISKTGSETSNIGGAGTATGKNAISISTQNEYPEASMSFINYMFTEEGIELANYGIEGETFTYENGKPVYTDMILNNSDGYNSNVARSLYTLNAFLPYYQTQEALELTFTNERMAEAEHVWASTRSAEEYTWNLNGTESDEYNKIASSLNTYMQEQLTSFVVGQRDLSTWDTFIQELRDMDLDRMVELEQQAFDRKYA